MRELFRRIDRWWYAPFPAERLAILRIAVGGFAWVYLVVRTKHLLGYAELPAELFSPLGVLAPLAQPLEPASLYALYAAALITGIAFVLGLAFRLAGPVFAVLFLAITTYGSSWGMIFHTENLVALHLLVLGCSPAADAHSLDARLRKGPAVEDGRHGWPVRLLCGVVVASYLLAGLAKLEASGLAWADGEALREQIAYNALRSFLYGKSLPLLAETLIQWAWCFPILAGMTLVLEVGAPFALLGRTAARLWVAGILLFHWGVLFTMSISFVYPLTGVAFLCFFEVEKLPLRASGLGRR